MSDAPPKLEVVTGGARREAAPQSDVRQPSELRRTWPAWLLLVLLWVALIGLGLETRRADGLQAQVVGLEGRVATLEGELGRARAALSAHREHLDSVRESVAELSALLEKDPTAQP